MTADVMYKLMQYAIKKNSIGGYLSSDDFNLVSTQAQHQYQSWLLGTFQTHTPGRPVARVEFGQNAVVRQRLTPTIYKATLTIGGSGTVIYPTGYLQTDAMLTAGNKSIRYVQQDSLDSVLNSVIDPVTTTNPIYLIESAGFQFYPVNTGTAKLSYIGKAPDIVWGFTLDAEGRPVYSAGASTHPVWDDTAMMDIIARALRLVGVNLDDNQVNQYANEIKTTGQ